MMYSNQYLIKWLCGYVIGALVGLGYDCFLCSIVGILIGCKMSVHCVLDSLEAPVWYKLHAEYGAYVQK